VNHGLPGNVPLVLAVEELVTEQPTEEVVNVALTAFRNPGQTSFRICATNLSRVPISRLIVRWWAIQA
jgi:hypothetical protein